MRKSFCAAVLLSGTLMICGIGWGQEAQPPDVSTLAVPWPPREDPKQSPFAERTCKSYSSYKHNGVEVDPKWGDARVMDFGPRDVKFDYTGVREVNQIPEPGVHPRILCTPADLPDIRRRLKETQCGQAAWKNLLCFTNMMKGQYDPKADYAQSENPIESNGVLSRVVLSRVGVGSKNSVASAKYQALIHGDMTQDVGGFWVVFPEEAFRCWVEQDEAGGHDLAAAVTTAVKIGQAKRAATRKEPNAPLEQPIAGIRLAYTYDFLYNYLNPEQRKLMHDELANATWAHDNYGTFNEATSSRSNWATFSYWLIETLAIEGEPGFNDLKVRGLYRGWRNLMTYGWYESGATYEGEAKNQLGLDGFLMFAMRKTAYGFDNLAAHPNARAYASRFIPQSVLPTRDGFVKYDLLGGTRGKPFPQDMLGMKYLLPNDPAIDFAYRAAVGEHYENIPTRTENGIFDPTIWGGYADPLIFFVVYATDFNPTPADPSKIGLGNTFFCGERALMMTRSSWDTDAMLLNLHVRQANGGHPFADRNSIVLAGAGRVWATIPGWGYEGWKNVNNSEVVIDDHAQTDHIPGRMVDFVDNPLATFAVGDASYAWGYNWRFDDPYSRGVFFKSDYDNHTLKIDKGWELEQHSVNDFSFLKRDLPYLNAPLALQPDWLKAVGTISPIERQPNFPVQRATRTAGLIRGPHPYALIVDDIQKDDAAHDYTWYMTTEYDVQIARLEHKNAHEMDIVLTGSDPKQARDEAKQPLPAKLADDAPVPQGQPMLLVRFLNINDGHGDAAGSAEHEPTILETAPPASSKMHQGKPIRHLAVTAHAVSPDFRVLLYPYHQGDALPETSKAADGTLTVSLPNQTDQISFASVSGKTNVTVKRDGAVLASVEKPIPPLTNN
jgi:hypothetical protein